MSKVQTSTVKRINELHLRIVGNARSALKDCIEMGEMLAKEKEEHMASRDWREWIAENCEFSHHTAGRYIYLWESRKEIEEEEIASISDAYALLAGPATVKNTATRQMSHSATKFEPQLKGNKDKTEILRQETSSVSTSSTPVIGTPPAKPPIQRDETGCKLTETALVYWKRRQEVQDWMTEISRLKGKFAAYSDDRLYGAIYQGVIAHLESLHSKLSAAKPYTLCTICGGYPEAQPAGCSRCGNTGMISKYAYDHQSDKDVKAMREKANRT